MPKQYSNEDLTLSAEDAALDEELYKSSKKKQGIDLYHDILWVDDRQNNNAENNAWKWMEPYCKDETIRSQIDQVDSFFDAVEKIVNKSSQYNLVIFDINLAACFGITTDQKTRKQIETVFRDYHIGLKDGRPVTFDELENRKKTAGYYLFRLLLAVGYPLSRMLIFSANLENQEKKQAQNPSSASDITNAEAQRELDLIIDDRIRISKSEHPGKLQPEIERRFSGKDNYYRIRRLVFQACSYWIDKLSDESELKKAPNIPFNKLYFLEEKNGIKVPTEKAIPSDAFINMLEHIRMLFPVIQPADPKKVYYQAMQIAASFHENSAEISKIPSDPYKCNMLKKYHTCIRNFRNWSAHNKLESKLDKDKFALMFCIAMRTYFSWDTEQGMESVLLPYEDIYGFPRKTTLKKEELKNKLHSSWKSIHKKLNSNKFEIKNRYKGYYHNLIYALQNLGYASSIKMDRYLFLPIWCVDSFIAEEEKSDTEAYVTFIADSNKIKDMMECSAKSGVNGHFMCYCQEWCFQDEEN